MCIYIYVNLYHRDIILLKQTLENEGAIKFRDMNAVFPYVLQFLQHVFFWVVGVPTGTPRRLCPLAFHPTSLGGKIYSRLMQMRVVWFRFSQTSWILDHGECSEIMYLNFRRRFERWCAGWALFKRKRTSPWLKIINIKSNPITSSIINFGMPCLLDSNHDSKEWQPKIIHGNHKNLLGWFPANDQPWIHGGPLTLSNINVISGPGAFASALKHHYTPEI